MRTIMESGFDIIYLITVISIGLYMILNHHNLKQNLFFGLMTLLLGIGDSFHLIPRIFALISNDFNSYAVYLGYGKLITSITMTVFYVILYYVYTIRYHKKNAWLTLVVFILAIIRISLCLFPQNEWTTLNNYNNFTLYRNIPFILLGLIDLGLFYNVKQKYQEEAFKYLWIAIFLSFAFYLPVVFYGHLNEAIGLLMIPKTLAYLYIVYLLFSDFKANLNKRFKRRNKSRK